MNDFNERIAKLSAEKPALLEAHLKGGEGIAERAIPRRPEFAPAPLSFAQQRMWFMDQLQPGNPAYNRPTHVHWRGGLNIAALENSVNEIVRRHEILRTSFLATDGQPVQAVASSLTLSLPVIDLGSLPAYEQRAEVSRIVTEDAQQREGATLFMTLLAAFQALLHRYTGGEDIIVGVPIAGRNRLEVENLIGIFINTLALRTDLSGNPSFRQLLGRVRLPPKRRAFGGGGFRLACSS